ncbi:MAG: UDP-N-acetylmuramate dehydrogenase [Paludibacteraceae bacterium]|nr:UDP-N-acetylmuramate dehydrogenase [Paludibacteraceae bacterium]
MTVREHISLLPYNTFGIDVQAKVVAEYANVQELQELLNRYRGERILAVGEGSNLLFTGDYDGVVLISRMCKARARKETETEVWIEAESGLKLDDLIAQLVDMNLTGLENLSHIPGTVGASAVQNVGAYGVEAKDVIEQVEAVEIATSRVRVFDNKECRYGYRDSIFKNEYKGQYIITKVVYRLQKDGALHTEYGGLKGVNARNARQVRDAVIQIRRDKLPEVGEIGSAGSFFKNPVVEKAVFENICRQYPQVPHYDVDGGVKIPAAWLIEQCGWKGKQMGGAEVYAKQPLVIINRGKAAPQDIMNLAQAIVDSVNNTFGINIYPEVNYI